MISRIFSIAPMGASVNFDGSMEFVLCAQIFAIGFRPKVLTAVSLAKSIAEAPSEIELELAAVTVPPSLNAGFSFGILSI